MRSCDTCNTEKPDPAFRLFGRGRKKTCIECEGGSSVKSRPAAQPAAEPAPAPAKLNGHLEVPSGLGFRASLEDALLQIEQDRPDEDGQVYTHSIALAAHEARKLIEWIETKLEGAS